MVGEQSLSVAFQLEDNLLNGFFGLDSAPKIAAEIRLSEELVLAELKQAGLFATLNQEIPSKEIFEKLFVDENGLFNAADAFSFGEWGIEYYFEEIFEILDTPLPIRQELRDRVSKVIACNAGLKYCDVGPYDLPTDVSIRFLELAYQLPIFSTEFLDQYNMRHQLCGFADFLRERGVYDLAAGFYWHLEDAAGMVACANQLRNLSPERFPGLVRTLDRLKDCLGDEVARALHNKEYRHSGSGLVWKIDALYSSPLIRNAMPDCVETIRLAFLAGSIPLSGSTWPDAYGWNTPHYRLLRKAFDGDQIAALMLYEIEQHHTWNHNPFDIRSYPAAIKAAKRTHSFIEYEEDDLSNDLHEEQIAEISNQLRNAC